MNEFCLKCGTILLYGICESEEFWCPICKGVELETKEKTMQTFREDIKKGITEANKIIKKYDIGSLLISTFVTREGALHGESLDFGNFMSYSELIKYLANCKEFGKNEVKAKSEDFQTLLRIFEDITSLKKMIVLLNNGFVRTISVMEKEVPKYAYDITNSISVDYSPNIKFESERKISLIKFTATWHSIKEILKENGFLTRTDVYKNNFEKFENHRLNEFWYSVNTKIGLELSAGDFKSLDFPDLKGALQYITLLEEIIRKFPFTFKYQKEKHFNHFSCEMEPVDLVKFIMPFIQGKLDTQFFMNSFFALYGNCNGFPIFLMTREGLFAGPRTTLMATRFLKAKYYREYLDKNYDIGKDFEILVAKKLEENGFSLNIPKDFTKKMINIKDNDKNPTLEIDIIAEYKKNLYIIECKSIVLTTDYLTNSREKVVTERLDGENIKQERRISYIKNHLCEFGYPKKIKKFHNIAITMNKEPINIFEKMKIYSLNEIPKLKQLVQ